MAYVGAYAIVGNSTVVEDVAQESFLDAYQNLTKLRKPAAFPGWFRRAVFGHSHCQIRQQMGRGRVLIIPLEDVGTLYTPEPDPATQVEQMQLTSDVHRAIQTLPESQSHCSTHRNGLWKSRDGLLSTDPTCRSGYSQPIVGRHPSMSLFS